MQERMQKLKRAKVGEAIKFGISFLKKRGISEPRLNAERLLVYVTEKKREVLYLDEGELLKPRQWDRYKYLLQRRGKFIPLQYLLGLVNFYGFDFVVDKRVLIPRPETEILVELALAKIKQFKGKTKILDLGTGSGNIALSLAKLTQAKIYATDISERALAVAKKNSQRLDLEKRVHFLQGDCFQDLKDKKNIFQMICSSPPYIPGEQLATLSEEIKFEPKIALDGGEDGLDFFRRIIKKAHLFLAREGYLILEIGDNQAEAIRKIVKDNKFLSLEKIVPDYQSIERIAIIKNG